MKTDASFMAIALDLAREAGGQGEVPVGAIVVLDGEIIGRGRNASITTSDPTAHAEIGALRDAAARVDNYRLVGADVYSTVEPCLMCLGAMLHARVSRLVYGATDPKVGGTSSLEKLRTAGANFNHDFEICGGVLDEDAAELLRDFFRERRVEIPVTG